MGWELIQKIQTSNEYLLSKLYKNTMVVLERISGTDYIVWFRRNNEGVWEEEFKIETLQFGIDSFDMYGNYVIVGRRGDDANQNGNIYFYKKKTNSREWEMIQKIEGDNTGVGDEVSIYGKNAITSSGLGFGNFSYWYELKENGKWEEVHRVVQPDTGPAYGENCSIYGNSASVTQPFFGDNNRGRIHFYQRVNGKWEENGYVEGSTNGELLGTGICALYGNNLVSYVFDGNDYLPVFISRGNDGIWRREINLNTRGLGIDSTVIEIYGDRIAMSTSSASLKKLITFQRKNDGSFKETENLDIPSSIEGSSLNIYGNYMVAPFGGEGLRIYQYLE